MENWLPLETRTLRENVTELIRQAIIEGRLEAGSELNQAQLAEQLGISRGPVREALGRLEQEGLIRNVPYKGVYVTSLSPSYVRELFSLRGALETFAVGLGIERLQPEDVSRLEDAVEEMALAAKEDDSLKLVDLDADFHTSLIELAQHDLLRRVWMPLEIGLKRCLYARHKIYTRLDEVIGTHPSLVAAIADHDTDQATKILSDHILEACEQLCSLWPVEGTSEAD